MKRLLCLSLTLPLLPLLSAPAQESKTPVLLSSPYCPLQVGTAWHYKAGDNKFSLRVTKHEDVGKVRCARVELLIDGKTASYEHIAVTADGVYRYDFDGKEARPPVLFLKLPPKKDVTWKVDSEVGKEKEKLKGTFKIGEDEITVPAGKYKVITSSAQDLDANNMKLSVIYYFAEKVGMVKQVIDVAGQKIIIELEKFEPATS
jgi:hypothetical protein